MRSAVLIVVMVAVSLCSASVRADELIADREDVVRALERARASLSTQLARSDRDHLALYTYACLKIGMAKDDPAIVANLDTVAGFCGGETYRAASGSHAVYVCGIEAMLLADAGGARYKDELAVIRDFLVKRQNPNGAWTYSRGNGADMSVSQYAILGLWAAERTGAKVEPAVWAKAVRFLLKAEKNGGFGYQALGQSRAEMSMTAAGLQCLIICRKHLSGGYGTAAGSRTATSRAARRDEAGVRFGILRPVVEEPEEEGEDEAEPEEERAVDQSLSVTTDEIDAAIKRAAGWLDKRFAVMNDKPGHTSYWFYTLERAGALSRRKVFGSDDWYNVCADALLPQQSPAGTWDLKSYGAPTDTAFVALFLARPTRKLAGLKVTPSIGGGLLSGGRGLPDDLSEFGRPQKKEEQRTLTPLEELLSDLSDAKATELPKLQERLVGVIQIADPKDLIGEQERLVELVQHEKAEIRRTALWAMGRTGDLRLARYPIAALDDRDVTVLTEARNALAWIARRPLAFGHPENPLAGVQPGATIAEKTAAVERWREGMLRDWGTWYLDASPYADRFDQFDLDLRARLARLPIKGKQGRR